MFRKLLSLFDLMSLPRVVLRHRSLLWQMTRRNIETRYKGSALGLIWSFVFPLVMLCVYTFVFSWLMGAKWGVEGSDWGLGIAESKTAFAIIMLAGLSVFSLFSESVVSSSMVVVSCPNFVKKVIFPLEILPLAQVMSTFILGMAWIVILFLGVALIFGKLSMTMLLLPIVLIPLFLLALGCSYFVASLGVYIRDTQYVLNIVMQLMFWGLPVVYPIKLLHDKLSGSSEGLVVIMTKAVEGNPLTIIIESLRAVFLFGQLPDWRSLAVVFGISLAVLQLGFFWFRRTKRGFADVL